MPAFHASPTGIAGAKGGRAQIALASDEAGDRRESVERFGQDDTGPCPQDALGLGRMRQRQQHSRCPRPGLSAALTARGSECSGGGVILDRCDGSPGNGIVWRAAAGVGGQPKQSNDPRNNQHNPQYANYWAPLTHKRHIPPHSAQPQHTNYWAPRTRKRHQQEHRPQRPTERSDPTQHAKGRTGDRPGPRKETTTRRNVTQGARPGNGCRVLPLQVMNMNARAKTRMPRLARMHADNLEDVEAVQVRSAFKPKCLQCTSDACHREKYVLMSHQTFCCGVECGFGWVSNGTTLCKALLWVRDCRRQQNV